MYVLDEPSIGLSINAITNDSSQHYALSDLGNTLIVVEHDEETIRQADWICDMGPGAGLHGGEVVFNGKPKQITRSKIQLRALIYQEKKIQSKQEPNLPGDKWVTVLEASHNNLKKIDASIPLGCFTTITGVSGSGKSSLISGILAPTLQRKVAGMETQPRNINRFQE